jgi:hypothetical protein
MKSACVKTAFTIAVLAVKLVICKLRWEVRVQAGKARFDNFVCRSYRIISVPPDLNIPTAGCSKITSRCQPN